MFVLGKREGVPELSGESELGLSARAGKECQSLKGVPELGRSAGTGKECGS